MSHITVVEAGVKTLLSHQNFRNAKTLFNNIAAESLNPFEKNVLALLNYYTDSTHDAEKLQGSVVDGFTSRLGKTSDSYTDIGGGLSDLGVMASANGDNFAALKHFKRALLMAERSYRVDDHLRSCLICNMAETHRKMRNTDESLASADRLIDILNRLKYGDIQKWNLNNSADTYQLRWTKIIFPIIRTVQMYVTAGKCIGIQRNHEEGVIYMSTGIELLMNTQAKLNFWSPCITSMILVDLAMLYHHSLSTRGRPVHTKHLQSDGIARLTQETLSKFSPSSLDLKPAKISSSTPQALLRLSAKISEDVNVDNSESTPRWTGASTAVTARIISLLATCDDGSNYMGQRSSSMSSNMLMSDEEFQESYEVHRGVMGVALMDIEDR